MKKVFGIILAIMMLACLAGTGHADVQYTRGTDARIKTETVINTATATLVSNITTNNRVIGYTFSDSAAGNVALIDASGVGTAPTAANTFAEPHVIAGGLTTVVFPFPRNISSGVVVDMSTSTGTVTIYYE